MSRIVPRRDARRVPSERYSALSDAALRVACPEDLLVLMKRREAMDLAFDDGWDWRFAGGTDPTLGERRVFKALREAWRAGYALAALEIAGHAAATMGATMAPDAEQV